MSDIKTTSEHRRSYQAFMLRLWQENPAGVWRVTLEDAHTQERKAFTGIDRFVRFLLALTNTESSHAQGKHNEDGGGKQQW